MYSDNQHEMNASQTLSTVWFGKKDAELKFVSRSTTCSAAFLSIQMRSIAISRLNTMSDGGRLILNRRGGVLNVWHVSHGRVMPPSNLLFDSSTWFGLARLITSYSFPLERLRKYLCSLKSSGLVYGTYLAPQHRYKCSNFLSRGIDYPASGARNSFVTLLATILSRSNASSPSSIGTPAETTSSCMLRNEPFGIGIRISIDTNVG